MSGENGSMRSGVRRWPPRGSPLPKNPRNNPKHPRLCLHPGLPLPRPKLVGEGAGAETLQVIPGVPLTLQGFVKKHRASPPRGQGQRTLEVRATPRKRPSTIVMLVEAITGYQNVPKVIAQHAMHTVILTEAKDVLRLKREWEGNG